jgi:hypothetical protein
MSYEFKFISECDPCELVRVKLNDEAPLAIVGAKETQLRRGVIPLGGSRKFSYIPFMYEGLVDGDFERYQVLSYGAEFKIAPDEAGACEIGAGGKLKKVGSLLRSKNDWLLAVTDHPAQVRYFNLSSGALHSEPGETARAIFGSWGLWRAGDKAPLLSWTI